MKKKKSKWLFNNEQTSLVMQYFTPSAVPFINQIGWEKKWVFFNNQTLFLRCIVKII